MDGFKDSTKTKYGSGGRAKGAAKVGKVMGEFERGTLHSGSKKGPEVTGRKQAVAIALSEARKAGAKIPLKKAAGGEATLADLNRANRDVGGMSASDVRRAGEAIGRGNRTPYERMPQDAGAPAPSRKPRSLTVEHTVVKEAPVSRSELDRKLSTLPSQKGEMPSRGKGSFRNVPLIGRALDAVGLKKGGLAAMPCGKKR